MMSVHGSNKEQVNTFLNGRYFPLQCFRNEWYECFFVHNDLTGKDDVSAVDTKASVGGVASNLEFVLQSTENSTSPSVSDEVRRFCKGVSTLETIREGLGEAGTRLAAWVDDRNSPHLTGKGNVRLPGTWLTATGLLRHRSQPRYNFKGQPDAERRLIYIFDLTPDMIFALLATATHLQVPALQDAICKHVSFLPSISVQIPSDGLPSFQMEFHLPFFALRTVGKADDQIPTRHGKRLREDWEEINLLTRDKVGPQAQESYRLHRVQMSCVVHGFDEWQWIAYAFEDTKHENYELDEVIDRQLDSEIIFNDDDEDPIALLLNYNKQPIWKPREYFLKAFENQIRRFCAEWNALVCKLEEDRTEYARRHPFPSSKCSQYRTGPAEGMSTTFDWTRHRMELVTKLHCILSATIREWNSFVLTDGDIGYFSGLDETCSNSRYSGAAQSLRSIKQTFKKLENDCQKLISLKESLRRDFSVLKILLSLECNAATENSAFVTRFSTWVLCPYFLAAGMFSMQPTVIPFDLTFRMFVITMLMLMFLMFVIQWLMRRWITWKKRATLWMKMRELGEEKQEKGEENLSA